MKPLFHLFRKLRYPGSVRYWERRYRRGGNSGAGSSGELARYKARVVNEIVQNEGLSSVLDLGCGDGQQLQLAQYPTYVGLDISPSVIERCRRLFADDSSKTFVVYSPDTFAPAHFQADMALSMEVLFHLTEEAVYQTYMQHLFAAARRFVVIFSSDETDETGGVFPHFKPRKFTPDVPPGWKLRTRLINPHRAFSVSDFFIFERTHSPTD